MFFSAGMPQPGFFLKLCIAIWYMWSKLHINWNLLYILFTYTIYTEYTAGARKKSEKTKSNSLERKYSVNIFYLIGKIAVLFSVCIHKSKYFDIIFYMTGKKHMFFSAGMPQPGFFLKFWIVFCLYVVKMPFGHVFFLILYTAGAPKNKKNQVP